MSEINVNQLLAMIGDRSDARTSDQALRTLYSQYDDAVRGFITKKYTQDTWLIDEVVQDTFVEVWKFPERYNDEYAFKTWLLGIARHKTIDALRQVCATSVPIEKFLDTLPADAPDVIAVIYRDQVSQLLKFGLTKLVENGKLSVEHREVLQLMYVEDLNVTEMAAIIRCPENTVKTRLHYARERVRSYFESCLTGFMINGEVEKCLGSTKIDPAIDHASVSYQPLAAIAKPQNTVTSSDDHKALAFDFSPASIPKAAGGELQAGQTGKPLLDFALPNYFQALRCQVAGGDDSKLAGLPAQNGQQVANLAASVDSSVTLTDCEQALNFVVSTGGNAVAAQTASGAATGTSSGPSLMGVNGSGGGLQILAPILDVRGDDHYNHGHDAHGHTDAYNHQVDANNSAVTGAGFIQLVGIVQEPAFILSGHHPIF